jgi:hypothetical protein
MFSRAIRVLLVSSLTSGAVWAANEPFVGQWKFNPSKSRLTDEMKVEGVAGNKYTVDVGGGAETIVADGTDQPGYAGTTLAISMEAPDSWKVVRKQEGRVLLTAQWKLSKDGKTLTDDFTQLAPNGSSTNIKSVYHRSTGTSGFAGTWDSITETLDSAFVITVQPYQGHGLSFINPSQGVTRNVTFDGKEHPLEGPNAPAGATSAAGRANGRTLRITTRVNDKVAGTQEDTLSADGKTLTMTVHSSGRTTPNILVFERQ